WFINPDFDYLDEMLVRMKETASRLSQHHQVEFSAPQTPPKVALPIEFRRNVMAIYKEGLNNVARHALASRVAVTITVDSGRLQFEIRDNGRGFNLAQENAGQGLRNLRNRADDMLGELVIDSKTGRGTTLKFKVNI